MRGFSQETVNRSFQNGASLSPEDAYLLSEATLAFKNDENNPKKAYKYFFELNKHHYYLTVIREFEAFKGNKQTSNDDYKRLESQYEYALDHLKQEKGGYGGDSEYYSQEKL